MWSGLAMLLAAAAAPDVLLPRRVLPGAALGRVHVVSPAALW